MNKSTSNLKKWIEKERKLCEDKHTEMLEGDFLSAEMCEEFPEYWLGRIKQIDMFLDWIEE